LKQYVFCEVQSSFCRKLWHNAGGCLLLPEIKSRQRALRFLAPFPVSLQDEFNSAALPDTGVSG